MRAMSVSVMAVSNMAGFFPCRLLAKLPPHGTPLNDRQFQLGKKALLFEKRRKTFVLLANPAGIR
jgi:hypothetical protein